MEAESHLGENAAKLAAKWGLPGVAGRNVALRPWEGRAEAVPSDGAAGGRPTVSLTMIVRDEERRSG